MQLFLFLNSQVQVLSHKLFDCWFHELLKSCTEDGHSLWAKGHWWQSDDGSKFRPPSNHFQNQVGFFAQWTDLIKLRVGRVLFEGLVSGESPGLFCLLLLNTACGTITYKSHLMIRLPVSRFCRWIGSCSHTAVRIWHTGVLSDRWLAYKMISSGSKDKKLPKALDKTVHELEHWFVSNNGFLRWIVWPRGWNTRAKTLRRVTGSPSPKAGVCQGLSCFLRLDTVWRVSVWVQLLPWRFMDEITWMIRIS